MKKKNSADGFYQSSKWLKIRERVLRRDNYIDQLEKRYGRIKEANLVHHILPREYYPEYELCEWNLISISKKTHNLLHDRDSNELTLKGIELVEILCRKKNMDIPERYQYYLMEKKYFKR